MGEPEQRVIKLLHALRQERAPDQLRANIERLRAAPRPARRSWRVPSFGFAVAGSAAAVLAAVVALVGGGAATSPIFQAAALALKGPVLAAPAPDHQAPQMRLDRDVGQIYFPNWARFGWRASGQRVDRVDGHQAVTVFYSWRGRSIAYPIFTSPPLGAPSAPATRVADTVFRTLRSKQRLIVTWRRLSNTCVLSAQGVPASVMYRLAAWHPAGSNY